ncbi:MAG: ABC transporter permease [Leptospirales bacterium]|nr:ABC transporter permease [Leptospirales bacterium]
MENNIDQNWTTIIKPKPSLLSFNLKDIWRYKDLIKMFVLRDFATFYKQTILGPLWFIIQPLFTAGMFTLIFGSVAKIPTDGIPPLLFYMTGVINWAYFSDCLTKTSDTFIENAATFGKVYFPRLTVPIATTLSALLKLLIQFVFLMIFLLYYIRTGNPVRPNVYAFLFPLMIIWIGALGTGAGMILSALTTKYRDLNHVLALALQLMMYVTPVVYPLSQVPQNFRLFFYINPVSAPMELFRIWFYGVGSVPNRMIAVSLGATVIVVLLGLILFTRNERTCMDVI